MPPSAAPARSRTARWLWAAAGWACFAVGAIGVVLPGIPTTGPMLLALACFARSNDKLHAWLLNHRLFGPPLQRWQRHRVIPLRAKVLAVTMMLGSFTYAALFAPMPTWAVVITGLLIAIGIPVVLHFPHHLPSDEA